MFSLKKDKNELVQRKSLKLRSKFRILMLVIFLFSFIPATFDLIVENSLVNELWRFLEGKNNVNYERIPTPVVFVLGVAYLVSFVGVLAFKSWARNVYTILIFVIMLGGGFYGPIIFSGYSYSMYGLLMLLTGCSISLMYFSSVSKEFDGEE